MSPVSIELSGTIYWSKPFDFENGDAVTIKRTEEYTWSREMTKVQFREGATNAVVEAKARSKFTGEAGGSWEVVTAKVSTELELSLDVTNTINSVSRNETKEEIKESGKEKTQYTVGPNGRIIAYQMHFVGPGISVASKQVITRFKPDPILEKRLSVPITCELSANQFLRGIKVVQGRWERDQPLDCIPVINNKSPDINQGFPESDFVWLVPVWGSKASDSETCTDLGCRESEYKDPNAGDLASGAGGTYRYLQIGRNPNIRDKIVDVQMVRSESKLTKQWAIGQGYDGISNDFNANRVHDYIYLIWKTIKPDNTVLS